MAGIRIDNIEKTKRIRTVQEYILRDYTASQIVDQCIHMWGVSIPQAKRYYRDAYENWREMSEQDADERRRYHIQARMKMIRDISEKERNTVAGKKLELAIRQDIAGLEGLYIKRFEHTGKDGEALNQQPTLTDEQFQKLLNEARTGAKTNTD